MLRQARDIISLQVETGQTDEGREQGWWQVGNVTRDQSEFLQLTQAQETSVLKADSSVIGEVEELQVWSRVKEVLPDLLQSVVGQAEVVELLEAGQIIA